jgi:hypothetical protein
MDYLPDRDLLWIWPRESEGTDSRENVVVYSAPVSFLFHRQNLIFERMYLVNIFERSPC